MDLEPPSGTPEGCLDLATLDAIAGGEEARGSAAHLQTCERCRTLLDEMRSANHFLRRFQSGPREDSPAPADAGAIRVKGYEIQSLLAYGGQGAVYRAGQTGTGRVVAIKVPLADTLRRPSARYRFEREIELTARLDHPCIVRVIGPCELADGRVGCVMEFIEGEPFDRWAAACRESGRGAVRQIVEAGARVADAIAFAHQRAVLHRDIKPSNVVVSDEGEPHVLDFGLAKALGDAGESFVTLTGAFVGTISYSAPEQFVEGADAIDMRTDVYALGLLLFQGLTGRLPHATDAPTAEILRQIRELPAPRPSSIAGDIDPDLDAILLRALAKEKDRRYATAAELRDDLRAWLGGRAVRARFDSRWYVLRKTVHRHRWPVMLAAVGVGVVTVTGTLGFIAREQSSRAAFAGAVRDARTLESHWVRMAEARSIGRDNFEAGEWVAWDALLEPEPVLVAEGIEGVDPRAGTPTSAAYWALWEMYLRTPVVFSAPDTSRPWVAYDAALAAMVCTDRIRGQLRWWDWRGDALIKSLPLPIASEALLAFRISPDGRWAQLSTTDWTCYLVDLETGRLTDLDLGLQSVAGGITNARAATWVHTAEDTWEWRLWAIDRNPPALLIRHAVATRVENSLFDSSGRFAAVISGGGEVLVVDAASGEPLYRKVGEVEPRFLKVLTRGNPGEFVFVGPGRLAVLDARDPGADLEIYESRTAFLEGLRQQAGAADADRYIAVSDRWRLGVGRRSDPPTVGIALPAISAGGLWLSDDGRFACGSIRPSGRPFVFDLDFNGVARLPTAAPVTETGFPTIFGVAFTEGSRELWVGAMDGSVRRFTVGEHPVPLGEIMRVDGGISSLRVVGDTAYAGTHDFGQGTATVSRVRPGQSAVPFIAGERWIVAMEADPSGRLWTLTGRGHLLLTSTETGELLREAQLPAHPENQTTRALARLPGRRVLLAGPAGNGVVLLDEDTLEPVGASVPMPPIREFAVSAADPDLVAVAGDDGTAGLWRFEPGPNPTLRPVRQFGTHAGGIFTMAFSPDGRLLATGGGTPETRDVRLWDVAHGRELAALDLFELGVMELAFSPDGRWLAVGGEVQLSDPEAGGQLYLIDLQAPARCIAGNLEYHIARLTEGLGYEPSQAGSLRQWAEGVRRADGDSESTP